MRWTQEFLGSVRAYVFAGVALLILIAYFVSHAR
jgi:hypothetical protein